MSEIYNYLSVCSGIEAFTVAVKKLDFNPVAFSEIEDFPSKVLAHHYPHVPNLGDMLKIDTSKLGRVDWLVGGVPCQSYSVAGLRRGLNDERGNLTLEFVRLAHELATGNGLRGLLFENVPGILSDATNAFGCLLGGIVGHHDPLLPGDKPGHGKSNKFWRWIAPGYTQILDDEGEETGEFEEVTEGYHRPRWPDAGMVAGPRARLAWRILDSRFFAVAQRRRRVFLVADFGDGPDPATVLFEPRGQGRRVASGGEARQEVAGTLANRAGGGGGLGTDMELGGGLQVASVDTAPTLRAGGNRTGGDRPPGSDVDTVETLVIYEGNAEGGNAELPSINASNGKKGINNQTPLISVFDPNQITSKANQSNPEPEMAHTMPATSNAPVLFAIQERATSTNLENGPGGKGYQEDIAYTMEARNKVQAVALALRGREGGNMPELGGDQANALRGADGGSSAPMVMAAQVRRLTPEECEKLQGYPVGYTRIPGLSGWRAVGDDENPDELRAAGLEVRVNKKTGKARVNDPDGPRYKALGNSFTTEPVNWIMCRVQASLRGEPMPPWQPLQLWKTPPV